MSVVSVLMKTKFKPRNDFTEWSVVNRVNNRGPRTDPCGTPVSNEIVDGEILLILTKLVLAVKYDLIQFNAVSMTLKVTKSV